MNTILIIGTGGMGRSVAWALAPGRSVLASSDDPNLSAIVAACNGRFVVAIGDNAVRERITTDIAGRFPALRLARLVPGATVAPDAILEPRASLMRGTVIMPGAIIEPGCRIGAGVLVDCGAFVGHDCELADFSSVGPGARLGGGVKVGSRAAVCMGATVRHGVSIGADTVIGLGAVVLDDVRANVTAFGNPARFLPRESGAKYL